MLWCVVIQGWKSDFASGLDKKQTRELLCESLKKLKSAKKLSSIFGERNRVVSKTCCCPGSRREAEKTDLLKSATDLLIKVIAKEAF